jgi:hypothetical protein
MPPLTCSSCRRAPADVFCDGELAFRSGSCNAPLCSSCALVAGEKHFCTGHAHQARLQRALPFAAERSRPP